MTQTTNVKLLITGVVCCLLGAVSVKAQIFDAQTTDSSATEELRLTPTGTSATTSATTSSVRPTQTNPRSDAASRPSATGSAYQLKKSVKPTDKESEGQAYIFMYMEEFKIVRDMRNDVRCHMKFYVWPTGHQISEISYRLRWEGMETPVSFNNVPKNTPSFFSYTLLGKGCYSMDKTPNIVVNRCRIKGMSQKQCADMISWIN